MVRIAIDAMSGDKPETPHLMVEGAVNALIHDSSISVTLVGNTDVLLPMISSLEHLLGPANVNGRLNTEHTNYIFPMHGNPTSRAELKDTSMDRAIQLVREDAADIAISPGNSGAFVTAASLA